MATNKTCSRDECPPSNIKPETNTKCASCKQIVHLPCIGITAKLSQIDSPNIRIFCNKCITELSNDYSQPADLNSSVNASKATPKAEKLTIRQIMNEVNMLRGVVETNGKKLDAISGKTDCILKTTKHSEKNSTAPKSINEIFSNSPKQYKQMSYTPKSSYAATLRQTAPKNSAKRKRFEEKESTQKFDIPKPKIGTKTDNSSLSVVPKPKIAAKPKYTKAIWVSRLNPQTTTDEIANYIVSNTAVTDKTKFNVHKLVKKDRDLTTLKFVSFKLELCEDEFNVLVDPDAWPEEVMVREFLQNITLGDYFPSLECTSKQKNSLQITETPKMQTNAQKMSPNQSAQKTATKQASPTLIVMS